MRGCARLDRLGRQVSHDPGQRHDGVGLLAGLRGIVPWSRILGLVGHESVLWVGGKQGRDIGHIIRMRKPTAMQPMMTASKIQKIWTMKGGTCTLH